MVVGSRGAESRGASAFHENIYTHAHHISVSGRSLELSIEEKVVTRAITTAHLDILLLT